MKRLLLILVAPIASIAVCFSQNAPKLHNEEIESSARYQKGNIYQKDLLLYLDMLGETHPYYADEANRAKLEKQAKRMYRECAKLTTEIYYFKTYLQRFASSLHDGHTTIYYWRDWDNLNKIFPIGLDIDGDNPCIINITSEEHRDLLGKEVVEINTYPVKQVLEWARPLVSADNEVNFENLVTQYLMIAEFYPKILFGNHRLYLTLADGSNVTIYPINKSELKVAQLQRNTANRVTAQRGVLFDYTIFEEEGICYMQFNQFADRVTHPNYPQLARFDDTMRDMMAEMEAKGIETLVVDLQYNGGGNSMLGTVLLSWLQPYKETQNVSVTLRYSDLLCQHYPYYQNFTVEGKPLERGKCYDFWSFDHSKDYVVDYEKQDSTQHVINIDPERIFKGNVVFIQGKDSFSSATLLLTLAQDNGIGIIIGERAGGKPCHYGDILYCTLPNTETLVTVSHKYFIRPDRTLEHAEYIEPDVMIDLDNPERDMAWEWIVENYGKK
ncbi:MAG: hypothetical protein IKY89_00540 [Alistipes sp.]|nr:hypothetical protein [Alistipes sp.]